VQIPMPEFMGDGKATSKLAAVFGHGDDRPIVNAHDPRFAVSEVPYFDDGARVVGNSSNVDILRISNSQPQQVQLSARIGAASSYRRSPLCQVPQGRRDSHQFRLHPSHALAEPPALIPDEPPRDV